MTNIYYCLPADDFSVWHKIIDAEETLHFHYGAPVIIFIIEGGKILREVLGGPDGNEAIVIKPNTWFAMRPSSINPYSVMSCSVEPGFEFEDLVIADASLLELLPESEHKLARNLLKY